MDARVGYSKRGGLNVVKPRASGDEHKRGGMDPIGDARGRGFDAAIAQRRRGRREEVVSGAERAEKGGSTRRAKEARRARTATNPNARALFAT
jgi:hypothetical protein